MASTSRTIEEPITSTPASEVPVASTDMIEMQYEQTSTTQGRTNQQRITLKFPREFVTNEMLSATLAQLAAGRSAETSRTEPSASVLAIPHPGTSTEPLIQEPPEFVIQDISPESSAPSTSGMVIRTRQAGARTRSRRANLPRGSRAGLPQSDSNLSTEETIFFEYEGPTLRSGARAGDMVRRPRRRVFTRRSEGGSRWRGGRPRPSRQTTQIRGTRTREEDENPIFYACPRCPRAQQRKKLFTTPHGVYNHVRQFHKIQSFSLRQAIEVAEGHPLYPENPQLQFNIRK